jgi:hypothetical protein
MKDNIYDLIYQKWTNTGWECKRTGSDCGSFRVYKKTKDTLQHIQFDVLTGWYSLVQEKNSKLEPVTVNKHLRNRLIWTLDKIDDSND